MAPRCCCYRATNLRTASWPALSSVLLLMLWFAGLRGGAAPAPPASTTGYSAIAAKLAKLQLQSLHTAPMANLSDCPKLRIAIINHVCWHYEVLVGLVHLFEPHAAQTDVYIHRSAQGAYSVGAWDMLSPHNSTFYFLNSTTVEAIQSTTRHYDLAILISPEYERAELNVLLEHMTRTVTVVYVHNTDVEDLYQLVVAAGKGGSEVKLVSLSPHTSALLESRMGGHPGVEWVLAAYPYQPAHGCHEVGEQELMGRCLRGFCIQGAIQGSRRAYGAMWAQMRARRVALSSGAAAQRFHLTLLGKGDQSECSLPAELQPLVTVATEVPYHTFYDTIHHTLALIPALSNRTYMRSKFTSSILSSLITGTPLIANRTFLGAYAMLSEESVFLQEDGELEVDAMLRVVAMPPERVQAVRCGVLQARLRVNDLARSYFGAILSRLCSGGSSGSGGGGDGDSEAELQQQFYILERLQQDQQQALMKPRRWRRRGW